jgi:hypothetical protein
MHLISLPPLSAGSSVNQLVIAHRRDCQRLLDQPLKLAQTLTCGSRGQRGPSGQRMDSKQARQAASL